jgi:hypothetical protein
MLNFIMIVQFVIDKVKKVMGKDFERKKSWFDWVLLINLVMVILFLLFIGIKSIFA